MAYSDFSPETHVQEAQDGMGFKIWDESEWNGESDNTTICFVTVFFINDSEVTIEYDPYELISGADKTKFEEYLDRDGHIINLVDLTIGGVAAPERFEEGYYVIRVTYDDGTYGSGNEPYYDNAQAFLAKNRCMKRKMAVLLVWPLTEAGYRLNRDIFLQGLYLEVAENAVDLGKKVQFRTIMALVKAVFNNYEIEECW